VSPMEKLLESNRELDKIISSIGDLPASPAIITTLMSLTSDMNTSIDKISKTILADQSLTGRVLKISNSSFYGRAKEVATLREAILLLGFSTLRSLVVASSTHSLYQSAGDETFKRKLWEHSLATAVSARTIACHIQHPKTEEAFIAGLMHDIGKLVMAQKIPDEYMIVVHTVEQSGESYIDVEERAFGFNHTDVGLLLLHKWSFPQILGNAVFEHHNPTETDDKPVPLSYIINLANCMAKRLDVGFENSCPENDTILASLKRLNLSEEDANEIGQKAAVHFEEEKGLYGLTD